jgi:hypothetical protein
MSLTSPPTCLVGIEGNMGPFNTTPAPNDLWLGVLNVSGRPPHPNNTKKLAEVEYHLLVPKRPKPPKNTRLLLSYFFVLEDLTIGV